MDIERGSGRTGEQEPSRGRASIDRPRPLERERREMFEQLVELRVDRAAEVKIVGGHRRC